MNGAHMSSHDTRYTPAHQANYAENHIYHPDLERLAFQCLSLKPDDRAQINELLWRTRKGLERWQKINQDVSGPYVLPMFTLRWDEEEFAVGGRFPEHWGWAVNGPPAAVAGGAGGSGGKKRKAAEGLPAADEDDDDDDDDDDGGNLPRLTKKRRKGDTVPKATVPAEDDDNGDGDNAPRPTKKVKGDRPSDAISL
jgi:hypothetical protein